MVRTSLTVLFIAVLAGLTPPAMLAADAPAPKPADAPRIQVALLLDTSKSMDGLINQARTQLWKIVNEFAQTKLGGKLATLEVALYEYGNDNVPASEGHIRLVVPLTRDLDKVSQELFALKTLGGQEYCGQVIDRATRALAWSNSDKDLKCIFIAGNEPFTQGTVDYQTSCKAAAAKGITVSTIFCGDHQEGIRTKWEQGAKLADGTYLSINQNAAVADIAAPQDKDLAKLSAEMSTTYVPYGAGEIRRELAERQKAQDANAARSAAGAAASRAAFKASGQYRNTDWDLVDAVAEGKVKLESVQAEQLPEALRGMTLDQRKTHLAEMAKKRADLQSQIKKLAAARDQHVAAERKKLAEQGAAAPSASFDAAVIRAVQEGAAKK